MSDQITKIYELRTLGYDQVKQDLDNISASFRDVAAAKRHSTGQDLFRPKAKVLFPAKP